MPPIVSVIGKSKSGKTTLIDKLVQELKLTSHGLSKHPPSKLGGIAGEGGRGIDF